MTCLSILGPKCSIIFWRKAEFNILMKKNKGATYIRILIIGRHITLRINFRVISTRELGSLPLIRMKKPLTNIRKINWKELLKIKKISRINCFSKFMGNLSLMRKMKKNLIIEWTDEWMEIKIIKYWTCIR